ncbi:helix-turn-helix domain-containing protein [Mesorhizobium loti]|uniref:helix-turn-helix domain-containing protein n=1 Tax=Rhizobium loti TaxID=381 RepID=UPI000479034A|nr:helix-turn-helix transcriptional regulator [Mesorhizobium loti]
MITAPQLRAARALLGIDQRKLADLSGLSVPTIQRMEASESMIRGNVDSLMKLIGALELAGVELIGDGIPSQVGGRGVRLKADFDPAKLSGDATGRANAGLATVT